MSDPNGKLLLTKKGLLMPKNYTLYTYYSDAANGQVTSAIHWRDIASFLLEHPDAKQR